MEVEACIVISSDSEDDDVLQGDKGTPARRGLATKPRDATPTRPTSSLSAPSTPSQAPFKPTSSSSPGATTLVQYKEESELPPRRYDESTFKDPNTGAQLPLRSLDDFHFFDTKSRMPAPLDGLSKAPMLGFGFVLPPGGEHQAKGGRLEKVAIFFDIEEWSIEYGTPPALWLRSKRAWYKLLRPKERYKAFFASAQKKFEACTGIVELLRKNKHQSFTDLVQRIHKQRGITEDFITQEAVYIYKSLSDAFPEYKSTPFVSKLKDIVRTETLGGQVKRRRLCHQCRAKLGLAGDEVSTKRARKCSDCAKYYCKACLKDKYDTTLAAVNKAPRWECPACTAKCTCSACKKAAAKAKKTKTTKENATTSEKAKAASPKAKKATKSPSEKKKKEKETETGKADATENRGRKRKVADEDDQDARAKASEKEEARKKMRLEKAQQKALKAKQARLKALRERCPMDDRELFLELRELGALPGLEHPPSAKPVDTTCVPMARWGDFLQVWSFVSAHSSYLRVQARTLDAMQRLFVARPEEPDLEYLSQLHMRLLEILLEDKATKAAKAKDKEEEEEKDDDEDKDKMDEEEEEEEEEEENKKEEDKEEEDGDYKEKNEPALARSKAMTPTKKSKQTNEPNKPKASSTTRLPPHHYFGDPAELPLNRATWPEVLAQYVEAHDGLATALQLYRETTVVTPKRKRGRPRRHSYPSSSSSSSSSAPSSSSPSTSSSSSSSSATATTTTMATAQLTDPRPLVAALRAGDYVELTVDERLELLRFLTDEALQTDSFWRHQNEQMARLADLRKEQRQARLAQKQAEKKQREAQAKAAREAEAELVGAKADGQAEEKDKEKVKEKQQDHVVDENEGQDKMEEEEKEKEGRRRVAAGKKQDNTKKTKETKKKKKKQREPLDLETVVRVQPLGYDRHGNRFWWVREPAASAGDPVPSAGERGRVFVERTPAAEGGYRSEAETPHWAVYESVDEVDRLMRDYLNPDGLRERALHRELTALYDHIAARLAPVSTDAAAAASAVNPEPMGADSEQTEAAATPCTAMVETEAEAEKATMQDKMEEEEQEHVVAEPEHRLVKLEEEREKLLDLEDRVPYQYLRDRTAYDQLRSSWLEKVKSAEKPAELCEALVQLEGHMLDKSFQPDWPKSLRRTRWRRFGRSSLATSLSQAALMLAVLDNAIRWKLATRSVKCQACRRSRDPERMLLCDGCDKGYHLFCLRPRLADVPNGEWYCPTCRANSNTTCEACHGGGQLLCCDRCPRVYHLGCLKPPLQQVPKGEWLCPQHPQP